jgi:hypothetical protein
VTVPPLSDEEVLTAIAERDPDAIALLYDRYGGLAYSLAMRMLPLGLRLMTFTKPVTEGARI